MAVNLVGDFLVKSPVLVPAAGDMDVGLVGELVLDATAKADRVAHDAGVVLAPAVDKLEGVVDAVLELLVAASHEEAAHHVEAAPVDAVVALWLVDKLRPDLLEGLGVPLGGDTDVELVSDLDVHARLHHDLGLLVVLNVSLCERTCKGEMSVELLNELCFLGKPAILLCALFESL